MNVSIIGYGRTGTNIADLILAGDPHFVDGVLAIETDEHQLRQLNNIPEDNHILLGYDEFDGNGTNGDQTGAIEAIRNKERPVEALVDQLDERPDAILQFGYLGGGTGGGVHAAMTKQFVSMVSAIPIYSVCILPSDYENGVYHANAIRALKSIANTSDGTILIDNDILGIAKPTNHPDIDSTAPAERIYNSAHTDVANLFTTLFEAASNDTLNRLEKYSLTANTISTLFNNAGLVNIRYVAEETPQTLQNSLFSDPIEFHKSIQASLFRLFEALNLASSTSDTPYTTTHFANPTKLTLGLGRYTDVYDATGGTLHNSAWDIDADTLPIFDPALPDDPKPTNKDANWPTPTRLAPLTLRPETGTIYTEYDNPHRELFVFRCPARLVGAEELDVFTNWISDHTPAEETHVAVRRTTSNKVEVIHITAGIAIPNRVRNIEQNGIEFINNKKREGTPVDPSNNQQTNNVFDDTGIEAIL